MIDQGASPYSPPKANLEGGVAQAGTLPLATAGSRLAAVLINSLLGIPAGIIAVVAAALVRPAVGAAPEGPATGLIIGWTVAGLYGLALAIYQGVMLSTRGQTIGKRLMKIRVEKTDGSPPGFVVAVLLREIVNGIICAVPLVGALYAIVDVLFIFRPDRRCIHDHIASTRVVMTEAASAPFVAPAM